MSAFALLALLPAAGARSFRPLCIDHADLVDDGRFRAGPVRGQLGEALAADGLVQVVGIPHFADLRERALLEAHACIDQSPRAQEVAFSDSTVRRTLAAAGAGAGAGVGEVEHGSDSQACRSFQHTGRLFREAVAGAADAFGRRLDDLLDAEPTSSLLETRSGGAYENLEQAVSAGQRLEHFHSYHVRGESAAAPSNNTLDFHVDQGLFIAFAPALMAGKDLHAAPASSGAFLLRAADGAELEAELRGDALVLLLGDAVDRLVNAKHRRRPFRAPSHAFRMPPCCSGLHRVWYGMMQLPPADALVEDTGLTFGEIRDQATRAVGAGGQEAEAAMSLGCSRKLQARELMATCTSTQIYCWHRCYDYTPSVSPTACAASGYGFNCTNQFDQIYISGHGDFTPKCTNSMQMYSPRPPVVQPAGPCSGFSALVADTAFTHRVALDPDTTYLLWSVTGGKLHAKMLHKGAVGWMAVGLESIGGHHNGMNGASVVMMKNDPMAGASVGEYKIHEKDTAHRHWKEPLQPGTLTDTASEVSGCFASMTFKASGFYNEPLNLTAGSGRNRMIWALTHLDYPTQNHGGYAGYHSATNGDRSLRHKYRGKVELDLPAGLRIAVPTPTPTPAPLNVISGTVPSPQSPATMLALAGLLAGLCFHA